MMPKKTSALAPKDDKSYQRTNKQKKFLKKPKNKTAKKQYFKELLYKLEKETETTGAILVKNDLEVVAAILKFGDISKELDVNVMHLIIGALGTASFIDSSDEGIVETFFNFARHNVLAILFQLLICLSQKVLRDLEVSEQSTRGKGLLYCILSFFNCPLGLKRIEKLLRNTEGFEIISQQAFWEQVYFSPKMDDFTKIAALWFSVRISHQKSFTEKFVENYVAVARKHIFSAKLELEIVQEGKLFSISQIILDSEQGEFLLKLVSDLPEKFEIIPCEYQVDELKSSSVWGKARALMSCGNCKVSEKLEKEFQKCARCGFVFYCSKVCQRNDWPNHKQICKEVTKQN